MNKPNFIASLGQSMQFVAFCAHFFCAAYVVSRFPDYHWWLIGFFVVGAAIKEFWFDANYETYPPQSFVDNCEDFLGWVLGAFAGLL